jgi:hypothetical protein
MKSIKCTGVGAFVDRRPDDQRVGVLDGLDHGSRRWRQFAPRKRGPETRPRVEQVEDRHVHMLLPGRLARDDLDEAAGAGGAPEIADKADQFGSAHIDPAFNAER